MNTRTLLMNKKRKNGGFTLVEMLVSVALFTVVMTIGLSVILSVVEGNKKTQSINSVVNNLNSSIDSMVRDMKTGIKYNCNETLPVTSTGAECGNTGDPIDALSFISTITGTERSVQYKYDTSNGIGYISKTSCTPAPIINCGNAIRITSPEINVTDMRMYVKNMTPGINQPGILLIIGGTARINPTTVSNFYLQTFVSRRVLNI